MELPLKDIIVTQPFGVSYVDFYTALGLEGHNGIDFQLHTGCPVYAAHDGVVTRARKDSGGGVGIYICSTLRGEGIKTIYYHLQKCEVKRGDKVKCGQRIATGDNTGKYTTGSHLHFGLKEIYNGATINKDNGFNGAIDPAPFFEKNWDKSSAYHRYGRKQNWFAEFKMRFKNPWLHRQLNKRGLIRKVYNTEFINALVYGGWSFEDVTNPAFFLIWGFCKKDDYLKGYIPFKS